MMEVASTISSINPSVVEIKIDVKVVYTSFAGQIEKTYNLSKAPSDKYLCQIPCPNKDCTEGFFDLSNEVSTAIRSGKEKIGTMKCCGQEEKYNHTNSFYCETILNYAIKPIISL